MLLNFVLFLCLIYFIAIKTFSEEIKEFFCNGNEKENYCCSLKIKNEMFVFHFNKFLNGSGNEKWSCRWKLNNLDFFRGNFVRKVRAAHRDRDHGYRVEILHWKRVSNLENALFSHSEEALTGGKEVENLN